MEKFSISILFLFFATNSLDKAESVKLELKTFDEIFGEGWWDKGEAEDLKTPAPTNFEPNSTDQNPPLTESDHSDNAKNGEEQNEITSNAEDERKRKIVEKFLAMKDSFEKKGKSSKKERTKVENEIAKHLKVTRNKIYKWKKEFGLTQKNTKNERKNLVEKFDQKKAELTRGGLKNAYSNQIDETVAKEFGFSFTTIKRWKKELGQTKPRHKHSHNEQKELMKRYYAIKSKNPKIGCEDIAKILKIGTSTLFRWKRQFKRQQLHPNSVDGHSVEVNVVVNVQEIENSNSGSI